FCARRRRHTRFSRDWSSDVCSSDLTTEDAEDVVQETFYEVCRSIGSFRGDGSLWGWIRTITSSKALMRLRRNKYRDTDELDDQVTPMRREDMALRMDLEAALERLGETSR